MTTKNEQPDAHWLKLFGDDIVWLRFVDKYADYEGHGCAIALMTDGTYRSAEYSHCSCYGPEESMTEIRVDASLELARRSTTPDYLNDLDKDGVDWTNWDKHPGSGTVYVFDRRNDGRDMRQLPLADAVRLIHEDAWTMLDTMAIVVERGSHLSLTIRDDENQLTVGPDGEAMGYAFDVDKRCWSVVMERGEWIDNSPR